MNLKTGDAVNIHWTREPEKSIDAAPLVFPAGWRPDFDRIQIVGRDSVIALFSGNGVLIYDIVGVSDQSSRAESGSPEGLPCPSTASHKPLL